MAAVNPYDARGTTVLVLGILGLVMCPFILGPTAWVMGNSLRNDATGAGYPEPSNGKAGRICGIVASVFALLIVAFYVFVIVLAVGGRSAGGY